MSDVSNETKLEQLEAIDDDKLSVFEGGFIFDMSVNLAAGVPLTPRQQAKLDEIYEAHCT